MSKRLTYTDRLRLELYVKQGYSKKHIADMLNRSLRSIFYELKRGECQLLNYRTWENYKSYSADIAQRKIEFNRTAKGRPIKLEKNYDFASTLSRLIKDEKRSPYHAADYCKEQGIMNISVSTIYRYIDYGYIPGLSNKYLPEKTKRKSNKKTEKRASRPPVGLSIEQRPNIYDRKQFGHWEMDTVIGKAEGKGQAVLVLTERKTRYEMIFKLAARDMASVTPKVSRMLKTLKNKVPFLSITVDNGGEFNALPAAFPQVPVYFCHPYCSSERGSNERNNREIRRYIPKGESMKPVTQKRLDAIAHQINTMFRPRSIRTTSEALFCEELQKWQNQG